jgi:hypothetical protein
LTVFSNGWSGGGNGEIYLVGGALSLTNTLIARGQGHALTVAGGTATVVNCTIADHTLWGITNAGGGGGHRPE